MNPYLITCPYGVKHPTLTHSYPMPNDPTYRHIIPHNVGGIVYLIGVDTDFGEREGGQGS